MSDADHLDQKPDRAAGADEKEGPSGRDLQDNPSQGEPLDADPGSDADHAAEVPHVG